MSSPKTNALIKSGLTPVAHFCVVDHKLQEFTVEPPSCDWRNTNSLIESSGWRLRYAFWPTNLRDHERSDSSDNPSTRHDSQVTGSWSCGCPKIAQQSSLAVGLDINNDVVERILANHYRPVPGEYGPSWLTTLGLIL